MSPDSAQLKTIRRTRITCGLAIGVFFAFLLTRILHSPSEFALTFNPFALISAAAAVTSITLLALVLRRGSASESRSWFILLLLSSMVAGVSEVLQRSSVNPEGALFWASCIGIGMAMVPVATYMFALSYTTATAIKRSLIGPVLIITGSLASFAYASGMVFELGPQATHLFPWGYNNDPGSAFIVDLAWVMIPYLSSIAMLLRYRRSTTNELIRKQSRYYAIALAIPLAGGGLTDALFPLLALNTPSMAIFINAIAGIFIYIGIRRYQFFRIDPGMLAENILSTMREAVVVARSDLHLEYVNQEAASLFGIEPKQTSGMTLTQLFPDASWQKIHDHLEKGAPLPTDVGQLFAYNKTKQSVPVQVSTSLLKQGTDYSAYVFVLSDVSTLTTSYNDLRTSADKIRTLLEESQRLQQQLSEEKANVEHTVDVRTKELREAQEKLKAEDRMKQEFIALSSHNLRTPLSIITASTQLLKTATTDDGRAELVRTMESGIKQLASFVEDISAINDLESGGQLDGEPINVNELLAPVIEETRSFATTKNLEFKIGLGPDDAIITANTAWLRNCVRNLLNNAVKFTEHGSISLRTEQQGREVLIHVADTGIGIKDEELPLLFTKFHRGTDFEQYDYDGEGLALYLTKLIVEQHDGRIEVSSTLGKGSTFTIYLPLRQAGA